MSVASLSRSYLLLLALFAITGTTTAYFIDDANSTILYTASQGGGWLKLNATNNNAIYNPNATGLAMLDYGRMRDQTAYVAAIFGLLKMLIVGFRTCMLTSVYVQLFSVLTLRSRSL